MQTSFKYNADGLIPAIVQDADTKRVLMMAWMNESSLALHARDRAHALLEPLAAEILAQRRDQRPHAEGRALVRGLRRRHAAL